MHACALLNGRFNFKWQKTFEWRKKNECQSRVARTQSHGKWSKNTFRCSLAAQRTRNGFFCVFFLFFLLFALRRIGMEVRCVAIWNKVSRSRIMIWSKAINQNNLLVLWSFSLAACGWVLSVNWVLSTEFKWSSASSASSAAGERMCVNVIDWQRWNVICVLCKAPRH